MKNEKEEQNSLVLGDFYRFHANGLGIFYGNVYKITEKAIFVATTRGKNVTVAKKDVFDIRGEKGRVKI